MSEPNIAYNIIGIAGMIVAVVMVLRARAAAATLAYVSLIMFHLGGAIWLDNTTIITLGAASCAVYIIDVLQGELAHSGKTKIPPCSVFSTVYMLVGSLGAALVAYTLNPHYLIPGAIAGAVLGLLAYVKTPQGKTIPFPSVVFFHYLCVNGLRVILTASIIAMVVGVVATKYVIEQRICEV